MVTIEQIKQLRQETELSISACKEALEEARGNMEKAKEHLKKLGAEIAKKKQARETGEGYVEAYTHGTGKLGALVDVRCETDFVARSPDFRKLCHELALQVASMDPQDIDEFLAQPYIRDPSRKVADIIADAVAKLGEHIVLKRFSRFEIA